MNAEAQNQPLSESRLVAAYVADLERVLAQSAEKDEIVASVREHITEALDAGPQDTEAVQRVLEELGPVERIAREAGIGAAVRAEAAPRPTSWGAGAAAVAAFLSLLLVFVMPFIAVPLAIGALIAGIVTFPRGPSQRSPADWLAIGVSTASLLIALLGALFLLPQGDPAVVPAGSVPGESAPAAAETDPSNPE